MYLYLYLCIFISPASTFHARARARVSHIKVKCSQVDAASQEGPRGEDVSGTGTDTGKGSRECFGGG